MTARAIRLSGRAAHAVISWSRFAVDSKRAGLLRANPCGVRGHVQRCDPLVSVHAVPACVSDKGVVKTRAILVRGRSCAPLTRNHYRHAPFGQEENVARRRFAHGVFAFATGLILPLKGNELPSTHNRREITSNARLCQRKTRTSTANHFSLSMVSSFHPIYTSESKTKNER